MATVAADPDLLQETFNSLADTYQKSRLDYPAALYDELVRQAGGRPGGR